MRTFSCAEFKRLISGVCFSGNALEEDLNLGDLNLSTIDREFSRDNDDTNSVCSSLSAGFISTSAGGEYTE